MNIPYKISDRCLRRTTAICSLHYSSVYRRISTTSWIPPPIRILLLAPFLTSLNAPNVSFASFKRVECKAQTMWIQYKYPNISRYVPQMPMYKGFFEREMLSKISCRLPTHLLYAIPTRIIYRRLTGDLWEMFKQHLPCFTPFIDRGSERFTGDVALFLQNSMQI